MRKFILTTVYFCLPLILMLIPGCVVLVYTRENFYDIDDAIRNFDHQKYLIGYLYNENNYRYLKYKILSERKATVVALGSSRVLPFRQEMFDATFYNAGFTVDNIQSFQPFLTCIPVDNLPDYLILGLDQWMFNDARNETTSIPPLSHWTKNTSLDVGKGIKKVKELYVDFLHGSVTSPGKNQMMSPAVECVGLNSFLHSTGFRNDGSSYYGELIGKLRSHDSTIVDYNFRDSFSRIRHGNRRLQYGREVSAESVQILIRLLSFCKSKGIRVIGFVPPFADAVYEKMKMSGNYDYIEKLYPTLKPIFRKYDFEIYCYNQVSAAGSSDAESIDGLHGGEKTYLRIIVNMVRSNSTLKNVCNVQKLEEKLTDGDNYNAYPY